jgi:hypothetical protein
VSWWLVHEFVCPFLDSVDSWPLAGSVAWCSLNDDDPIKWVSLFDAAQHHALRMETAQQALANASRDVAAAADWSAIARPSA